jgi:hypothetical protein
MESQKGSFAKTGRPPPCNFHSASDSGQTLPQDHLQNMVDRSHATSTTPAVLPAVASNRDDLEIQEKTAIDVDDRHPPQPGDGVNNRRQGSAQVDPPPRKRANSRPCFPYTEHEDGKPPEMSLLHVHFARFCVDLLRKKPDLTQNALITHFIASEFSRNDLYPIRLIRGRKSSGRAIISSATGISASINSKI